MEGIRGKVVKTESNSLSNHVELFINDVMVKKTQLTRDLDGTSNFDIGVYDIWRFAKRADQISMRFEGRPLEMPGGKNYAHPFRNGKEDLDGLAKRFDAGQTFDDAGKITRLPKDQDFTWQEGVLTLYQSVARTIESVTGAQSFLYSGTLLGFVREGGFIPHDKDMDCAYLSKAPTPQAAAVEFGRLGDALITAGYQVTPKASCISVRQKTGSTVMVDIAHLYIKQDGFVGFPFGTVGVQNVSPGAFEPVGLGKLSGFDVAIPARPTEVVEHVYGNEWRMPDPGFKWSERRNRRDAQALLSYSQRTQIAMDDYYSRPAEARGSLFVEWLSESDFISGISGAIDVGCGNGRDSEVLSRFAGLVVGVDRSRYAVEAARNRIDHNQSVQFVEEDVLRAGVLKSLTEKLPSDDSSSKLFYLRFLLNGLTDVEQEVLFQELHQATKDGDIVAFEHRTEADRERKKEIFRSYRRFVVHAATVDDLARNRFEVIHAEDGVGFAPFGREDPHVVRIIAKRV